MAESKRHGIRSEGLFVQIICGILSFDITKQYTVSSMEELELVGTMEEVVGFR